jgi:hypothetical protein
MKRQNNLYPQICSIPNLELADRNARKRKTNQYGIILFDKNKPRNIQLLHEMLISKTYRTSAYTTFTITDPKVRIVYRLPYFPDRIAHHAIMNIMKPIFLSAFTRDTYSCIEGIGIHAALDGVKMALKDVAGTKYCLKLDIKKFYPSVDHEILKQLLCKKIKDRDLMWLMNDIIDSAPGVPIGNYLSQYLANFYLAYFDHWIKEDLRVKYYFRYADDVIIPAASKEYLHDILHKIIDYLDKRLKLTVKENYQIFPVAARSIDFVGYNSYHTHIRLRSRIKKRFARSVARLNKRSSISGYNGWIKHCNGIHLLKTILNGSSCDN